MFFKVVSVVSFIKEHWKSILIALAAILMLPLIFASGYTVESSVPALDGDSMRLYIDGVNKVGKDKTVIDWKNLIAIDSVRYKQEFTMANSSNIEELAKKFIKENKKVIHYDFAKYKNSVDVYNNKYNINLDYRYVIMVDSLLKKEDFSNQNQNDINSLIDRFIIKNQIPEEYEEEEVVEVPEVYYEWEYIDEMEPWRGKHRVKKTRMVKKTIIVKKNRYKEGIAIRDYESVLINLGYNEKDIPEFFKDVNKINVTMDKTIITYTTKSLDEVLNELGFSPEEKEAAKRYRDVGLNVLFEDNNSNGDGGETNPDTAAFINKISAKAVETYKKYKVFPSITIAQGIVESGSGGSGLARKANNLFGIKAYNWNGPRITMPTFEYYGAMKVQVMADFRVYNSWDDSVDDHGKFLVDNSTYRNNGVFDAKDYIEQAFALKKAGYATDPKYPVMLINIIQQYGLNKYDSQ